LNKIFKLATIDQIGYTVNRLHQLTCQRWHSIKEPIDFESVYQAMSIYWNAWVYLSRRYPQMDKKKLLKMLAKIN
jgi:hypothetical protein